MSERNTFIRSLHDLGMAAWFGGSLMGAVGLNGATAKATDSTERLRLSSIGWARWAPVQVAAIGAHAIGGVGLIISNRRRLAGQQEARSATAVKLVVTALAIGSTAYSGVLGAKIAQHADEGTSGVTEPSAGSSAELSKAQEQQKFFQWATPVLTGALVVMGVQQGEQQRGIAGLVDLV